MTIFFDTSVLIATFRGDDPRHAACLELFRRAKPTDARCAAHSLAELYAVMTGLPVRPRITPDRVMLFMESLEEHARPVALTPTEYAGALRRICEEGISGGAVYDALILQCARKCNAERIYTLNVKDVKRVAPDLSDRISAPPVSRQSS